MPGGHHKKSKGAGAARRLSETLAAPAKPRHYTAELGVSSPEAAGGKTPKVF